MAGTPYGASVRGEQRRNETFRDIYADCEVVWCFAHSIKSSLTLGNDCYDGGGWVGWMGGG